MPSCHVWFASSLASPLNHYKIKERLKPTEHFDAAATYVLMQCTSLRSNKQSRGCIGVLYKDSMWCAIHIVKLKNNSLEYKLFKSDNLVEETVNKHQISCSDISDFYFATSYDNHSGTLVQTHLNMLSLNPTDEGLEASVRGPTTTSSDIDGCQSSKKRKSGSRGGGGRLRRLNSRKPPKEHCLEVYYDVTEESSLHQSVKLNKYRKASEKTILLPNVKVNCVLFKSDIVTVTERNFFEVERTAAQDIPKCERQALKFLETQATAVHHQIVIDATCTVRFVALPKEDFQRLRNHESVLLQCRTFFLMTSRLPTVELPGVCVSSWMYGQKHIDIFSLNDVTTSTNIFGRGYGDRNSTVNVGCCTLTGPRRSSQPIQTQSMGLVKTCKILALEEQIGPSQSNRHNLKLRFGTQPFVH